MSRLIQYDFDKLIRYLKDYNLNQVISDSRFNDNAKCIHRKLYALLIFNSEMEVQNFFSDYDDNLKYYFQEIGSDLILAFFCWVNGAYKPAELQLRSSIENFIKSLLYAKNPSIISVKNVFEIFDFAAQSNIFNNSVCIHYFSELKSEYSALCAFVHSSPQKLSQYNALVSLPTYDALNAIEFCTHYKKILNNMLSTLYYTYYDNIYKMHEQNRDLFLQGLLKSDKAKIYQSKTELTI